MNISVDTGTIHLNSNSSGLGSIITLKVNDKVLGNEEVILSVQCTTYDSNANSNAQSADIMWERSRNKFQATDNYAGSITFKASIGTR